MTKNSVERYRGERAVFSNKACLVDQLDVPCWEAQRFSLDIEPLQDGYFVKVFRHTMLAAFLLSAQIKLH